MLPPPVGGTVALSSQVRYPGSPGNQGRPLRIQVKFLARWRSPARCLLSRRPPACPPPPPARLPRACAVSPEVCKFSGSVARAPPRLLCPPPALAHPPAVRLRRLGDRHFRASPGPLGAPPLRGAAWAGRPDAQECGSGGWSAAAGLSHRSLPTSPPPPPGAMAGSSSLEAVRRKIRSLQEQADAAEERAGSLQRELDYERKLRETVRDPPIAHPPPPRGPPPQSGPLRGPGPSIAYLPLPSSPPGMHLAHLGQLVSGSRKRPCLFFSALFFHLRWFKVKARRGSRSGVEKVLEAPVSQKGLYFGGYLLSVRVSWVPRDVHFALLAVFTRRVGREEGNPFGNPFLWKGTLTGQVWGTATL